MDEGLAQAQTHPGAIDLPTWKTVVGVTSAVLLSALFLIAGIWKLPSRTMPRRAWCRPKSRASSPCRRPSALE
jgi:hypothetical protein